ncbi:MAG: IS21 family transposase, partial [Actinomycetia bacterium]|nr:IS21 family transposase [Actinomycetes bacterium]
EKKGKVESGVKYVKNNFIKARKDEKDVEVLRRELARWVREIAGMRRHGTTHKRPLEVFEQVERATMLPLPTTRWEPVLWRTPMLRRDCRAVVEAARYSAPWRLIGKTLLARVTHKSVELYFEDTRVASHERQPEGGESTKDEHLPPERSAYRHRQRALYWETRAGQIGDDVQRYVAEVFDSDDVLHQLTKVQAIVGHLEKFPPERAQAACRRASFYGSFKYQSVKNILVKGLDMQPLPTAIVPAGGGLERPRHARAVQELLDIPLEENNASN